MRYVRFAAVSLITVLLMEAAYSQARHKATVSAIFPEVITLKYQPKDSGRTSQTDTLRIPRVNDHYPQLKRALSDENLFFGDKLKAVRDNYANCGCGIVGLSYAVMFETKDVISLELYYDTMTSYPDTYQKWLTLNKATGKPYPLSAEISRKGLVWLFKRYKRSMLETIDEEKRVTPDEDDNTYDQLKTAIIQLKSDVLFSKYEFTRKGIVLSIDPILPHFIRSQEPGDDLVVSYPELKRFILPHAIVLKRQ